MTSSAAVMSKTPSSGPNMPLPGTTREASKAVMLSVRLNPETGLTCENLARWSTPAMQAGMAAVIKHRIFTVRVGMPMTSAASSLASVSLE